MATALSKLTIYADTLSPTAATHIPAPSSSGSAKALRGSKTPRKVQTTRLEAIDGSVDPLGPLGDSSIPSVSNEPAPTPPRKEQQIPRTVRPASAASQTSGTLFGTEPGDSTETLSTTGRAKLSSTIQLHGAGNEGPKRQTQPSMSVEQAARPTFDIQVGDPHKVGDLTSSHIVYQVRTRTTSKAYRQPEFAVSRRYRDFLWLYNSLHANNPGIVVPPPPEKQAVGRFDSSFVESRRAALERMLNKTAAHPVLQHDGDLKIFLESETFNVDVKNKENREPDLGQNKGMFGSFGLGNSSGKFVEHDDVSSLSEKKKQNL